MTAYGDIARLIKGLPSPQGSIELHGTIYFALRREGRDAPAALYARVHFCLRKSHARPRVQQAPGLPCALNFEEGQTKLQTSDATRREIAKSYPRRMGRAKRNPSSQAPALMGIASLHPSYGTAMTGGALPLIQHPALIGAVQRERRHIDLEPLPACVDHLVAPGHE